jgi:hypothetical protein
LFCPCRPDLFVMALMSGPLHSGQDVKVLRRGIFMEMGTAVAVCALPIGPFRPGLDIMAI